MFSSFKIAIVLLIMAGAGGGFPYVKNLKADLAVSEANNAKLEQSIDSQKAVIEQMQKDFKAVQEANANLNKLVNTLNDELKILDDKFNKVNGKGEKRDLGDPATKKPKPIERIINKGSAPSITLCRNCHGQSINREREKCN